MEKRKLILPISIVLGCIILGGFHYAIFANRQKSEERQQVLQLIETKRLEGVRAEQEKVKEAENKNTNCQYLLKYLKQRWNNVVGIYYGDVSKTCIVKYTNAGKTQEAPIDDMQDNKK